jgi:glycerophosphoryl diester phosphodiesterase
VTAGSRRVPTAQEPLTVAHRAGNDLERMATAARAGVDLVEADVHLSAGRVEVRHTKTMGPIPLLWDRWSLHSARAPRLLLGELLDAVSPEAEVLFDLKGHDVRLAGELAAALRRRPGIGYAVCSQSFALLAPFEDEPAARVLHSAGRRVGLARLLARLSRLEGVSVHSRLLTPRLVERLLDAVPVVTTWPVNTPEALGRVAGLGVTGVTSDELDLLRALVEQRRTGAA